MFDRLPLPSQFDRVIIAGGTVAALVGAPVLVVLLALLFSDTISGPEFVFYLAAVVCIAGALGAVLMPNVVHAALCLVATLLGVAGILDIYRSGGITIANAPGTGIADDKAIYSYMPEIVEFYTGQKPILQNVPTWRCTEKDALAYVLDHLDELVVKEVHGSGGYGMLVGPAASRKEIAAFRKKLEARPGNYIAQPTLALSTVPVLTKSGLAPRHVDLRPFVLVSPAGVEVTPGGLTRVAMKKGSLVVNSSQGGGTKDTWVLKED